MCDKSSDNEFNQFTQQQQQQLQYTVWKYTRLEIFHQHRNQIDTVVIDYQKKRMSKA